MVNVHSAGLNSLSLVGFFLCAGRPMDQPGCHADPSGRGRRGRPGEADPGGGGGGRGPEPCEGGGGVQHGGGQVEEEELPARGSDGRGHHCERCV